QKAPRGVGALWSARLERWSGGLLDRNAGLFEMSLQLARLKHLAHDIAATDEFALDVKLGNGWPVGIVLDALAEIVAFQNVGGLILDAEVVQDLDDLPGKTALWEIGGALHEQENIAGLDLLVDEGVGFAHGIVLSALGGRIGLYR